MGGSNDIFPCCTWSVPMPENSMSTTSACPKRLAISIMMFLHTSSATLPGHPKAAPTRSNLAFATGPAPAVGIGWA